VTMMDLSEVWTAGHRGGLGDVTSGVAGYYQGDLDVLGSSLCRGFGYPGCTSTNPAVHPDGCTRVCVSEIREEVEET